MKKSKQKILFYTIGTEILPSSRVRIYNYQDFLKKQDVPFKIVSATNTFFTRLRIMGKRNNPFIKPAFSFHVLIRLIIFLSLIPFFDIIVIQKVLFPSPLIWLLERITIHKRILFDIDDAIFMEKDSKDSINDSIKVRFIKNISIYDLIITSTEHLKKHLIDYFSIVTEKIIVIPNYIDTKKYTSQRKGIGKTPVIGWIGTPTNTHYLREPLIALDKLRRKGQMFSVLLCGAIPEQVRQWYGGEIEFREWSFDNEVAIYDMLDIGIMPLPDEPWTAGKAGYKLMLYMSMGKIAVASAVGANKEIIEDGVDGFLVKDDESWGYQLKHIINHYNNMKFIKQNARNKIIINFSINENHYYLNLFTKND